MRRAVVLLVGVSLLAVLLSAPIAVGAEDLSFSRAVELAEKRSEFLLLQASAVKSADLTLAEDRGRLGPELTFQAGGGYMAHPPQTITVEAGDLAVIPPSTLIPPDDLTFPEDQPSGYFELSLQLSQPIYTWGKLRNSLELSSLGLDSAKEEFAERKRQLQRDLHAAYFSGVLARDSLSLLEQILEIFREIQEDRQRAFELGSANHLSVLQIQTQSAQTQRRIVQAEQAYATALEAIAVYTDLDPGTMDLSTGFRMENPGFTETELKEKALENSPALKKARLDQEKARVNLELTRGGANLRPDFSINVSLELSGQTIPWSEPGWEDGWHLNLIAGLGTQGVLFDAGRSRHQLDRAEETLGASQLSVDLIGKQIRLQTRQAVEALQLRWAELQEAKAAVVQSEEEEKNAGRAFQQELLIREQWGMARIDLLLKRLVLLEKQYSFELALNELEALVGFF